MQQDLGTGQECGNNIDAMARRCALVVIVHSCSALMQQDTHSDQDCSNSVKAVAIFFALVMAILTCSLLDLY